ncbi:MAG: hypothetical protein HUK02_06590, partial [Bacteroidaceae bacterium]|nr:hypothetical protein [Bacteroidaceae bacterium]
FYEDDGALKYFHTPGGDSARIIVIDPMCVYATDSVTVRVNTPYEKGKGDWFQGTYLFEHNFQLRHADD